MSEDTHCTGNCSACEHKNEESDLECKLKNCLGRIAHKIVVMSGKGGVGKSTVAVNLALALAVAGKKVGLLDVDVHGPSIPKMLHLEGEALYSEDGRIIPVTVGDLKVMSVGFMLENPDSAVIWRGPMKIGVIQQFLTQVAWDDLDYLIVDCPPGTGDEPLSVCQMLSGADGAVVVTTPQQVAACDVSKSVDFCRKLNFPVLGIVENMCGFACPKCGEVTDIFSSGAGEILSKKYGVPLLGRIPIDPIICRGGDDGRPFIHHFPETATARAFSEIIGKLQKDETHSV